MNWDAIAAIGEIIGAAGVIVTLVYLGYQIRQNTGELRQGAFRDVFGAFSNYRQSVYANPDVADLLEKASINPEQLSNTEEIQLEHFYSEGGFAVLQLWRMIRTGKIPERSWPHAKRLYLNVLASKPAQKWWAISKEAFDPDFVEEFESHLVGRDN